MLSHPRDRYRLADAANDLHIELGVGETVLMRWRVGTHGHRAY